LAVSNRLEARVKTARRADLGSARVRVADAMHRGVLTCSKASSLEEVAELMATRRVHCVVVTEEPDDAGSLWGIVSDLDLVAAAAVRDLGEQAAGASAATSALTISPEETLRRAAQLMAENGTAHLVVVSAQRRPVGILSTLDVAAALSRR
jgi:CBS domain-containing protein